MLVKSDPLSAVDIYCKFPVSENPTFDDAYIFGEIVRLLMKSEKYDDPRLPSNMISLGRVMGIGEYLISCWQHRFWEDGTVLNNLLCKYGSWFNEPFSLQVPLRNMWRSLRTSTRRQCWELCMQESMENLLMIQICRHSLRWNFGKS